MYKILTCFQAELFQSCYRHYYSAVGIVGPSAEFITSLQSHENYSIILIDNASEAVLKNPSDHPASRHELQIFLVSISTVTELKKILQNLMTSQWWNHMASFLIVHRPSLLNQGCIDAYRILWTAWKKNLLNAKLICHHKSKGPMIYSHNPYTNQAPIPWQLESTVKRKKYHPWTLLFRSYQDSREICKNLDFDQTKDLGGYEIRVGWKSWNTSKNAPNIIIARYMIRALNSTLKLFSNDSTIALGYMIIRGDIDITAMGVLNLNYHVMSMIYPHTRVELAFMTQHLGNLSQIEKLLRVIDQSSRYAVIIVCCITFAFFKFFLRQSVISASLTIVRLICNAAVPNLPNNVATRIFLSGLFIFVITLQGIYQGKFASLLTKPVALPNVETIEDLENSNYTIYSPREVADYLKELNYSRSLVPLANHKCVKYVLQDHSAACFMIRPGLVKSANMYDLHLSDTIIQLPFAYIIKKNWPLEKRMNILISRLVESNIIEYVFTKDPEMLLRKRKIYEKEKENQGFTVIALKDLAFAFVILGIGLTSATIVFFIEVWKKRKLLLTTENRG